MNKEEYLDDMLNQMSEVMINLQSDVIKVMGGINKLNLIIENIKKFRTKNSNNMVNNGGINNFMNNNDMLNNNMMMNNNMMYNDMMMIVI